MGWGQACSIWGGMSEYLFLSHSSLPPSFLPSPSRHSCSLHQDHLGRHLPGLGFPISEDKGQQGVSDAVAECEAQTPG